MSFEPLTFSLPFSGKIAIQNKGTQDLALVKYLVVNNNKIFSQFPSTI